ncbi:MAG: hemolysin C [Acidocella sp. 20-57-95]|nr:MAG: hemolysin C [Acidocella sp. 20-57-95]OYV60171.1 MAG: hemolysin C [Acidocella sp. 21-58-7]HQT63384.1 hemolysin family protein [Acidocella sp.]HQU05361.1 hemolysin family protein [Acidocella sp.]
MHLAVQLLILAILILLNGAFALSELALVSSRRAMLTLLEREGLRGAAKARALADNPQAYLPASQFGITLIGILTGVFGGDQLGQHLAGPIAKIPFMAPYAAPVSLGVTVFLITLVSLVFGELVPKQLALRQPERVAVIVAQPLSWLALVASPVVWFLGHATKLVLRLFGPAGADRRAMSEEELKAMLVEGAETGVLETEERDMIERVLRLADKPVRAIMTPRTEIAWIDRTAPRPSIIATLRAAPHSRFVVCDGAIDNVAGIVQAKDILDRVLDGKEFSLAAALRQPIAIPDSVSALEALERLKSDTLGIAIVLDEYGSFEGMVTAADVLEAIVGDADDAGPKDGAPEAPDDVFELDGLMPVDETKARLHLPDLPNEGSYHTLGGLILALLMRLPRKGDAILFGGWRFEVLAMDGRRIERVRVERDVS